MTVHRPLSVTNYLKKKKKSREGWQGWSEEFEITRSGWKRKTKTKDAQQGGLAHEGWGEETWSTQAWEESWRVGIGAGAARRGVGVDARGCEGPAPRRWRARRVDRGNKFWRGLGADGPRDPVFFQE